MFYFYTQVYINLINKMILKKLITLIGAQNFKFVQLRALVDPINIKNNSSRNCYYNSLRR